MIRADARSRITAQDVELLGTTLGLARADDLDAALSAITQAGVDGLGASMGAIFLTDPDRAGLSLAAASGLPVTSTLEADAQDPSHPFHEAATGRVAAFDRPAPLPDGRTFMGAYLPLLVSSGGVEVSLGAIGFGWEAPHELDDTAQVDWVRVFDAESRASSRTTAGRRVAAGDA